MESLNIFIIMIGFDLLIKLLVNNDKKKAHALLSPAKASGILALHCYTQCKSTS